MTHPFKIKTAISGLALLSMMIACAAAVPAQEVKTTAVEPENTQNIVYGISEQDSHNTSLGIGIGCFLVGGAAAYIVHVRRAQHNRTKESTDQQTAFASEDQSHE